MISLNLRNIILLIALNMSLCLIVHAGLIHSSPVYDEEFLAALNSNGLLNNAYENSNHNEREGASVYPYVLPSYYDDTTLRQLINKHRYAKRSKLNLHTNLNLPRYLRTVD